MSTEKKMKRRARVNRDIGYALLGATFICSVIMIADIIGKNRDRDMVFEPTVEFSRAYAEVSSEFAEIGSVLEAGIYPNDPEHVEKVLIMMGGLMKYHVAPLLYNISKGIPPHAPVLRAALDDQRTKIRMNAAAARHESLFRSRSKEPPTTTTTHDDKHWVEPLRTISRYFYGAGSNQDLEFSALTAENEHYKTLPWTERRQIWLKNLRAMAYHILLLDAPADIAEGAEQPQPPSLPTEAVCEENQQHSAKLPRFKLKFAQDCTHPPADPSLPQNPLCMN